MVVHGCTKESHGCTYVTHGCTKVAHGNTLLHMVAYMVAYVVFQREYGVTKRIPIRVAHALHTVGNPSLKVYVLFMYCIVSITQTLTVTW